jgi:hypothetical protein
LEIQEPTKQFITDEEKRIYQLGLATIKELRGASETTREALGSQALQILHKLIPHFKKTHPRTGKDFFQKSNH